MVGDDAIRVAEATTEHRDRSAAVLRTRIAVAGLLAVVVGGAALAAGGRAVVGVGGLLVALALGRLVGARRRARSARGGTDLDMEAKVARIANEIGVTPPRVVITDDNRFLANIHILSPWSATLLINTRVTDRLSADEVEAVLAHEIAHIAAPGHQFVSPGADLALALAVVGIGFALPPSVGVSTVAAAAVATATLVLLMRAVEGSLHRRYERRADDVAIEAVGAETFVRALDSVVAESTMPVGRDQTQVEEVARYLRHHPSIVERMERAADRGDVDLRVERER